MVSLTLIFIDFRCNRLGIILALGLGVATPSVAQAQTPSRPFPAVPPGSPLVPELPQTPVPTAPALPPPAPSPSIPFPQGQTAPVEGVTVNGATVIPQAELDTVIGGLTGPAVSLNQIERARQALVERYRAAGYLLGTVSTVLDRNRHLRFDVIEGYIAEVRLDGDIGPAGVQVLRFLDRITRERPVRISTIERYLLLAGDVPGVRVRAVLRPSSDDPAAITLIAQVSRRAVDGLVSADNRAFRLTGPEQALAVAGLNSFTEFGERTELSLLHSFNNTQTFGQAATEFFVGGSGLKIRLYGGAGDTAPSGSLRAIGYDGNTRVFGAQLSYPVIRSRVQTLTAIGAFDAIESDISEYGPDGGTVRASFDSVRVLRFGGDYTIEDLIFGNQRVGVNTISLRLTQGLNTLGATPADDPQTGRAGSRPEFLKFNGEVSRRQTLVQLTPDSSIALFGLVAGQASNAVLPPSEEFSLGGLRYNRGFYAGEVTGDNALTATAELQYSLVRPISLFGKSIDVSLQFYAFHDWGETWQNQSQDSNQRLRSFGGGLRSQITPYLGVEVEVVSRATRNPDGPAGTVPALKADALYWRVISRF